jgi:hypothetical protein
VGHEQGRETAEGEDSVHALIRSLIRQRFTGTPQTHHHHLAQALASAPAMLPNRPHLELIDTRSKHITRQGYLQTRSQEQLMMMISRVSAFWAPPLLWPPCLRISVEALPISSPFSRSTVGGVLVSQ